MDINDLIKVLKNITDNEQEKKLDESGTAVNLFSYAKTLERVFDDVRNNIQNEELCSASFRLGQASQLNGMIISAFSQDDEDEDED